MPRLTEEVPPQKSNEFYRLERRRHRAIDQTALDTA
jgi:hypothetical protein